MRGLRQRSRPIGTAVAAALLFASASSAAGLRLETLRFVDPNPEPSPVVGYRLHVGPGAEHTTAVDIGMPTAQSAGIRSYPLWIERGAKVYVALTAYDGAGLESPPSNGILRGPRGPAFDHDADGASDLLRVDPASGGIEILRRGSDADPLLLSLSEPEKSSILARGDFDGNGSSDIVWQRKGSRALTLWLLGANGDANLADDVSVVVNNSGLPGNGGLPGPVAAYGFDEGHGTKLTDASGNRNEGRLSGATWTSGYRGQALAFDGLNDVVVVDDSASLHLGNGMTLEAWVRPTSILSGWKAILAKEVDAFYLVANSPSSHAGIGGTLDDACCTNLEAPSTLPVNQWTHVAGTYDGTTLRLYLDGTEVASRPLTGSLQVTSLPLRIGGSTYSNEFFPGLIDEVRIYDRALTAAEIQADRVTPDVPPAAATTAPPLSLTAPPPGVLSGVVTLRATAAVDAAFEEVQFLLDGEALGPEDTMAPYELSWDSRDAADGLHSLSARARRAATSVEIGELPTPGPRLRVLGVGDLDANGRDDLVFQDAGNADLHLWLMRDDALPQQEVLPGLPAPWRMLGIGDVEADRRSDLVWWDPASGAVRIWQMNGAFVLEDLLLPGAVPKSAKPIGLGDYDADGAADLLVRHPVPQSISFSPLRSQPGPFSVIAAVPPRIEISAGSDFDGDGLADLALVDLSRRTIGPLLLGPNFGNPLPSDFSAASMPADLAREIGDSDNDWQSDYCDADFDNDGVVGTKDFRILWACIGEPAVDECAAIDADGDGSIGSSEIDSFASRFGRTPCEEILAPQLRGVTPRRRALPVPPFPDRSGRPRLKA